MVRIETTRGSIVCSDWDVGEMSLRGRLLEKFARKGGRLNWGFFLGGGVSYLRWGG